MKRGLRIHSCGFEGAQLSFQCCELARELVLLLASDIGRNGAVHGVVGPLVAVAPDLVDLLAEGSAVAGGLLTELAEMFDEVFAESREGVSCPLGVLAVPEASDGLLDAVHRERRCLTVVDLGVSARADVVLVLAAGPAGADRVEHAGLAVAAVDRSGEVVMVRPFAILTLAIRGEAFLHGEKSLLVDQRFVRAGVLDALVSHEAEVVAAGQHGVDLAAGQRTRRPVDRWATHQSSVFEGACQLGDSHVRVGGVLLERPPDVFGLFGIDSDSPGFTAVDEFADVGIANWGPSEASSVADLLFHALDDFLGEVLAVEVGDGREDAVDELPLGCLVDIFGYGDQSCARGADRQVDRDIVFAVAGQPVDLVDDDHVHSVVAKVLQHLLELWAVGAAAGLTGVGELLDDHRADGLSLGPHGAALGWDR